jgi:hypothetical protein
MSHIYAMAELAAGLRERNKREKLQRIKAGGARALRQAGIRGHDRPAVICERAGIGTGTLFLLRARQARAPVPDVRRGRAPHLRRGRAAGAREPDLCGQLMAIFGRFIAYYARDPATRRRFRRAVLPRARRPSHGPARSSSAHVADLVAAAQARGELRRDVPPLLTASALFAHYTY